MSRIYFKINSIFFVASSLALYHRPKGRCLTARTGKSFSFQSLKQYSFTNDSICSCDNGADIIVFDIVLIPSCAFIALIE